MSNTNKLCVLTGATEGIGKATAQGLLGQGFHVVMIARNAAKAEAVRQELLARYPQAQLEYLLCDLSSLADVQRCANEVLSRYDHIDVLLNNAGVAFANHELSQDGYEMNLAVNHLAHFLFTNLLLERINATPQARIINVASAVYSGGKIDFENFTTQKSAQGMGLYSGSKLMNILFTLELADRLKASSEQYSTTVNALHPGVIRTQLGRNMTGAFKFFFDYIAPLFFSSPEKGAATSIFLASSREVADVTGKYFDNKKIVALKPVATDAASRKRLWEMSEALVSPYMKH